MLGFGAGYHFEKLLGSFFAVAVWASGKREKRKAGEASDQKEGSDFETHILSTFPEITSELIMGASINM